MRTGKWLLVALCLLCSRAGALDPPQPRVCRPVGEARPASFQSAIDQPVPTHIRLMGFRYVRLQQTVDGFTHTGRTMVSLDDDGVLSPAECGDDPGLYRAVPALVRASGMTVASASDIVLAVCLLLPLVYAGFLFRSDQQWQRKRRPLYAGLILVFVLGFLIGDLYLVSASVAVLGVAVGTRMTDVRSWWTFVHLLVFGALAAIANSFRAHSGTAGLLFVAASIFLASATTRRKAVMLAVMLTGLLAVMTSLHVSLHQRDRFLEESRGGAVVVNGHPFWHTIYVGLGYVNNPQVPALRDSVAVEQVRQVDPSVPYYSGQYERILRSAVFDIALQHPMVILANVIAKSGTIIMIAAVILLLRRRSISALWTKASFPWLIAAGFSALAGVLAYPAPRYLAGMLSFLVMYRAVNWAQGRQDPRAIGASA